MIPLKPVSSRRKAALGLSFFALFVLAWGAATFGGFVSKTFLADPLTMLREGWALFAQHGFARDVAITIWRVVGGFVLAAALAVPLAPLRVSAQIRWQGIKLWARRLPIIKRPHHPSQEAVQ